MVLSKLEISEHKEELEQNPRIESKTSFISTISSASSYRSSVFEMIPYRTRAFQIIVVLFIILIVYSLLLIFNAETRVFPHVGGALGFISSLTVILAFYYNPKNNGPPLSLLYWHAFCDMGVALRFVGDAYFNYQMCGSSNCILTANIDDFSVISNQSGCTAASVMLEFFEMTSELWFLCIGIDLLYSLASPFSTFKSREKRYHCFVWLTGLALSIPVAVVDKIKGFWYITAQIDNSYAFCWIDTHKVPIDGIRSLNWRPFVFFYIPMTVIYVFCIYVLGSTYKRLLKGISNTLLHRMRVLITNSINVTVCIIYWIFLGIFYSALFFIQPNDNDASDYKWLFQTLLFLISAKGVVSIFVWILVTGIKIGGDEGDEERIDLNTALKTEIFHWVKAGLQRSAIENSKKTKNTFILRNHNDVDVELDGEQKNIFNLRFFLGLIFGIPSEIAKIKKLYDEAHSDVELAREEKENKFDANSSFYRESLININQEEKSIQNNEDVIDDLDEENQEINKSCFTIFTIFQNMYGFGKNNDVIDFTEYSPVHFRRIRRSANISAKLYHEAFNKVLKERLVSGGASGAFFFFSGGEQFIAKSCTEEELDFIRSNSHNYANYLCENPDSFISKIYGAYRLRIYGVSLNFFVQMNLFLNESGLDINEKYDIKGSWVSRNGDPALMNGQSATCTHCGKKYIFKKKSGVFNKRYGSGGANRNRNNGEIQSPFVSMFSSPSSRLNTVSNEKPIDLSSHMTMSDLEEARSVMNREQMCPHTADKEHEPIVILKDNDLKYNIKLSPSVAEESRAQLKKDADFLLQLGVMDYSLLGNYNIYLYFIDFFK